MKANIEIKVTPEYVENIRKFYKEAYNEVLTEEDIQNICLDRCYTNLFDYLQDVKVIIEEE